MLPEHKHAIMPLPSRNLQRQIRRAARTVAALGLMLWISACGGDEPPTSGGTGTTDPNPPGSSTGNLLSDFFVENFDAFEVAAAKLINEDSRYLLQQADDGWYSDKNSNSTFDSGIDVVLASNPLRHAGIQYAHAASLTGQGAIVAVSDSGYLTSHEAIADQILLAGDGLSISNHGTFVSSVIAGDSETMIGVAPGASLIIGMFDSLDQLTQTAQFATDFEAVALNNSWGYVGAHADFESYSAVFGSDSGQGYLNAVKTYSENGVVLFAVSNDYYQDQIGLMAGLPILENEVLQGWLAVVNGVPRMVDGDIVSADRVSGACLEAAAWCLAADGSWTGALANSNTSYSFGTGTSFATPTVSGALALLTEAFPNLSPHDLRLRLLASADNTFDGFVKSGSVELVAGFSHDISDDWGHGFLDVKAALEPIGTVQTTLSDGSVHPVSEPLILASSLTGRAVFEAMNEIDIVAEDRLSGSFMVSASTLLGQPAPKPLMGNGASEGCCSIGQLFDGSVSIPVPFNEGEVSLLVPTSDIVGFGSSALVFSDAFEAPMGDVRLSFGFGTERTGLIPSFYGGEGSQVSAVAGTYNLHLDQELSLSMGFALGSAKSSQGAELNSEALLDARSLSLSQVGVFSDLDRLSIQISAPFAAVHGQTKFSLPIAKHENGFEYQDVEMDLRAAFREYRVGLDYTLPLSDIATMDFGIVHAFNRGNVEGESGTGIAFEISAVF